MRNPLSHIRMCFAGVGLSLAAAAPTAASEDVRHIGPIEPGAAATSQVLVEGPWGTEPGAFGMVDEASRPGPMDFAVTDDATLRPRPRQRPRAGLRPRRPPATRNPHRHPHGRLPDRRQPGPRHRPRRLRQTRIQDLRQRRHATQPTTVYRNRSACRRPSSRTVSESGSRNVTTACTNSASIPTTPEHRPKSYDTLAGRPTIRGSQTVHAHLDAQRAVVIRAGESERSSRTFSCSFEQPVISIAAHETDATGRVYVATRCRPADPDTGPSELILTVINPGGTLAASFELPNQYFTDHYRKVFVTETGEIVQMQTTAQGARFVRWTLPTPDQKGAVR